MKALIVYYSYSGNNESLARELRLRLGCDIVKIEEMKRRNRFTILLDLVFKREPKIIDPNIFLDEYETVVFIAPIWNFSIAAPLVSYLKQEKENINNYAFITVCGGREGQAQKITDQLFQLTSKKPIAVAELPVSDLLLPEQRKQVNYVTSYRIKDEDFVTFKKPIQQFVNAVFDCAIKSVKKSQLAKV